jgi:hypothetical protein
MHRIGKIKGKTMSRFAFDLLEVNFQLTVHFEEDGCDNGMLGKRYR